MDIITVRGLNLYLLILCIMCSSCKMIGTERRVRYFVYGVKNRLKFGDRMLKSEVHVHLVGSVVDVVL